MQPFVVYLDLDSALYKSEHFGQEKLQIIYEEIEARLAVARWK